MLTTIPQLPSRNGAFVFGQPPARARRIAMIPAPEYWRNGTAASTAMVMQVQTGVCRLGDTRASGLEIGSVLSRDMPKHSRIVDAMIDRQQTKIAADTTNR